ncbi:MAG TPA: hypothetical protein VGY56_09585 [Verrucomicrobiae bacterium]|nr:hypothetical protein [Verrucomicrobiae bacterium]
MLQIASNVDSVIERTRKLRADIPAAMQKALAPDLWLAQARDVAERTLLAISEPEQRKYIQPFVNTVSAQLAGITLSLKMRSPFQASSSDQMIEDARAAAASLTPKEIVETRGLSLFMKQVENFEAIVLEWVQGDMPNENTGAPVPYPDETGKRKDARDWGKTDEEIARFISHLLLTPDPTKGELAAREKLEPHIAKYIANRLSSQLSEAIVEIWLKGVMAAWRAMLCAAYPARLHSLLKKAG